MCKKTRIKIMAVLLCCSLLTDLVFVPGQGKASIASIFYENEADVVVVDGVTYHYRTSLYDTREVQITAIHVPDGMTELVLPSAIGGRAVTLLHLRELDGAEKLPQVRTITLPRDMIFRGRDMNPTCVSPNSDLTGYFLEPSLDHYFMGLEEVLVDPANTTMVAKDGILFSKDMTAQYFYPHQKKNEEYREPDTIITNYGDYAHRKYLKKLTFSANKKYQYTSKCNDTDLETVVMPPNIKYIWVDSFMNCKKMKSVQLPKNLLTIEKNAFRGCTSLRDVRLPEGLKRIYAYAFWGTPIKKITIPESVTGLGKKAFSKKTQIIKPSYLKSKKAKYSDPAYYEHSYFAYQALVTLKNQKTGKKKCYPVYDLKNMWTKKKNVKLKKGETFSLKTMGKINLYAEKYKTGVILPEILKYRSSKPGVVKVNQKGRIKALKKGKAAIYVTLRTGYNYYMEKTKIKMKVKVSNAKSKSEKRRN